MKKSILISALAVITIFAFVSVAAAVSPHLKPPPGKHFNLNIIGFAQCEKNSDNDPDCFKGTSGDIQTHGHTIFVPLKTAQTKDVCSVDPIYDDDGVSDGKINPTVTELKKGVRILVTDYYGDDLQVIDRDATDGTAKLNLPDGCYQIFARPLGKPNGCMDIDTIICYDYLETSPGSGVYEYVHVDCRTNLSNDQYEMVGHLNVDRSKSRPKWTNATNELLNPATGVGTGDPGYFDFFWQIFNQNLRLVQLRIYDVGCD